MEVPIPDRLKGIRLIHRGHRTCSPSTGLVPVNMAPRPCSQGAIQSPIDLGTLGEAWLSRESLKPLLLLFPPPWGGPTTAPGISFWSSPFEASHPLDFGLHGTCPGTSR